MLEPFLCPHRRGTKKDEEESGRQSVLTSELPWVPPLGPPWCQQRTSQCSLLRLQG